MAYLLTIALFVVFLCRSYANSITYEAENAFHSGKLQITRTCTVGNIKPDSYAFLNEGTTIIFTVNIPEDGVYPVTIEFTGCDEDSSDLTMFVIEANGHVQEWDTLYASEQTKTHNLSLRAGLNTISYEMVVGNLAVDKISITGGIPLAARGATLNYITYEAEDAKFTGTLLGPNKTYLSLPSEASQRKAVEFLKDGDNVEFTLTQPANAVVIRFSIPDANDGSGRTALLGLYIDDVHFKSLTVTSLYSWVYGSYPFSKNPGDGAGHHFYDDIRLMFGKTLSAGTKVRLQGESAISYTIDLANFYSAPNPYPQPSGYVSVTDFGADPSGQKDSLNAFNQAIAKAKSSGTGVWIPSGQFMLSGRVTVDDITVRGAGPWYTEIIGNDVGFFGNYAPNPSKNVKLYDFAIFGRTRTRVDSEISSGVGGSLSSSLVQNLWIEHDKCGMWVDGPFDSLLITGCTIRNTFADGINFHKGITNSVVEQTDVRNTGDDGLAMWPEQPTPYGKNTFRFNTVATPILANTIAIYGGDSNSATDNVCYDTLNFGGGVQVGTRFNSVLLSGTTTVARNTLIRTGSAGYNTGFKGYGAIWLYSDGEGINTPVYFTDMDIQDTFYSAIQFYQSPMSNLFFKNITVNGADFVLEERVQVTATISDTVATNVKVAGIWNCGIPCTITNAGGNSGWISDSRCA